MNCTRYAFISNKLSTNHVGWQTGASCLSVYFILLNIRKVSPFSYELQATRGTSQVACRREEVS